MIHTKQICKIGDSLKLLKELPSESVDTVVTSPPYWQLRNYQVDGQIGQEDTLEEYHGRLLEITAEIKRVMKGSAVLFWNHGDSYGGSGGSGGDYNEGGLRDGQPKVGSSGGTSKCMLMQNDRLIIRMIDEQGYILRNKLIWYKSNGMPSSVTDRFSNKYEMVYMLVKQRKYWFDLDAVRKPYTKPMNRWGGKKLKANGKSEWDNGTGQESYRDRDMRPNILGKNPGDVVEMAKDEWLNYCTDIWDRFVEESGDILKIPTQPHKDAHFAIFPDSLVEPLIKAACPPEICSKCGFVRERITEKIDFGVGESNTGYPDGNANALSQKRQAYRKMGFESPPSPKTIGWTTCNCENPSWIAGTVLDPFAGSGTVGMVARKLNRNAILLELNPEYGKIINERTMAHTPPLTAYSGGN